MNYESTQYKMKTVVDSLRGFVNLRQRDGEALNDYLDRFKASRNVFLSHGGKHFEKLIQDNSGYANAQQDPDDLASLQTEMLEEALTHLFLNDADQTKCGTLVALLVKDKSPHIDKCPKTMEEANWMPTHGIPPMRRRWIRRETTTTKGMKRPSLPSPNSPKANAIAVARRSTPSRTAQNANSLRRMSGGSTSKTVFPNATKSSPRCKTISLLKPTRLPITVLPALPPLPVPPPLLPLPQKTHG